MKMKLIYGIGMFVRWNEPFLQDDKTGLFVWLFVFVFLCNVWLVYFNVVISFIIVNLIAQNRQRDFNENAMKNTVM